MFSEAELTCQKDGGGTVAQPTTQLQVSYKLTELFSTFLSLRHTNFERKFGGTLRGKKETK
jgi:hypothetical protein